MSSIALLTMASNSIRNFFRKEDHPLPAYLAILLGSGIGMLSCVFLNKALNSYILNTCNRNLNQIVYLKTFVGDSYGCVSRKVLYGPSAPIKP